MHSHAAYCHSGSSEEPELCKIATRQKRPGHWRWSFRETAGGGAVWTYVARLAGGLRGYKRTSDSEDLLGARAGKPELGARKPGLGAARASLTMLVTPRPLRGPPGANGAQAGADATRIHRDVDPAGCHGGYPDSESAALSPGAGGHGLDPGVPPPGMRANLKSNRSWHLSEPPSARPAARGLRLSEPRARQQPDL